MVNAAVEHPAEAGKLSHQDQLASLLGIKAGIASGVTLAAIVSKFEGFAEEGLERIRWAKLKSDLAADQSFGGAIKTSGLFSAGVERIFAVVDDVPNAVSAAIEYLNFAIPR